MNIQTSLKSKGFTQAFQVLLATIVLLITGCAQTLPQQNKAISFSLPDYQDTKLYRIAERSAAAHPELTGFYPIGDGQAAFVSRLALIENAEKSLDIQYYIYLNDETSQITNWYLYQAAERGVRVRLLLDDMQSRDDELFARLSAHPNIEVRLFNPFNNRHFKFSGFLHDFKRLNRRMHNKAIIADGAFAIIGGRNIGNEYFSANKKVEFGDIDLLLVGSVLPDIETHFDEYWNHRASVPIANYIHHAKPLDDTYLADWQTQKYRHFADPNYAWLQQTHPGVANLLTDQFPFYWSNARFDYDPADKISGEKANLLIDDIAEEIQKATSDFVLVSPYFVPTKKWTELLVDKRRRGINVTIVTNSLASNDVFAVHGWYKKYRTTLLKSGVKLYETKVAPSKKFMQHFGSQGRSSLHAKAFTVDDGKIFIGSFNFDPRSMYTNTEMGVYLDSPEFVQLFHERLDYLLNKTSYRLALDDNDNIIWHDDLKNITHDSEPDSNLRLRFGSWLSGVLPVENLL